MKRSSVKGARDVFAFTFKKSISAKGYILFTAILAVVIFGIVFAITALPHLLGGGEYIPVKPDSIILCDTTAEAQNGAWLDLSEQDIYSSSSVIASPTLEKASDLLTPRSMLIYITQGESGYSLDVLLSDDTELKWADADLLASAALELFRGELLARAGVTPDLLTPPEVTIPSYLTPDAGEEQENEDASDGEDMETDAVFEMAVSYITVFIMYFMILIYGQGAANSVMLEKTSRLMDFFLVSVKPAAVILGKVLAIALSALMQVSAWIFAAVGGYFGGRALLASLLGESAGGDISTLFASLSGLFSPVGIVIALLIIITGFLLYCALAALGGAMASKPEDLGSTNTVFSMLLIISFLLTMYSSTGMLTMSSDWMVYFPFTAILLAPARALTGSLSPLGGIISLAIIALTALGAILLAGKVYTLMSFWRGNPPTPAKMLRIVKESFKKK